MSFASLLNSRCTIRNASMGAQGDDGHPIVTYSDQVNVACQLSAGNGKEMRIGKQNVVAEYVLFLSASAAISEADLVVIDGKTYNVLDVKNPRNMNHHLECALELIKVNA